MKGSDWSLPDPALELSELGSELWPSAVSSVTGVESGWVEVPVSGAIATGESALPESESWLVCD